MAAALMLIGAFTVVVGTALIDPQAAVVVAGGLLLAAGVDLGRSS